MNCVRKERLLLMIFFLPDANIYLSIFGEKTKIERYHLDQASDPSHNFFEAGGVDRFRIYNADVGKVNIAES